MLHRLLHVVAVGALALVGATAAGAQTPPDEYVVTASPQGAGGNPGFLYVGGPTSIALRGGEGGPFELCITPRPIGQPGCQPGETERVISGPAFSEPGRTELRFTFADGRVVSRTARVRFPEEDDLPVLFSDRRPAAGAFASSRTVGVVVRLKRSLPREGPRRPGFLVAPRLRRGELRPNGEPRYGGSTPTIIGRSQRHCYLAEALRPRPLARIETGARWSVGLLDGTARVAEVAPATLRRSPAGQNPLTAFARRLGCFE